ncbi:MAG: glycoside hydrolase family 32 protein [Acidobacteria bacterium]|nr:glycoside hydrolase family 32 protein [Acidobacteriota bacterium]
MRRQAIAITLLSFLTVGIFGQYSEKYRPQIHFSPPANWMNDPNGMVYHNCEYHLFYQYYPNDTVWGPMHWGHAVSRDLVRWKNLPIALEPDKLGYIFSGSAVADKNNSAGFKNSSNTPLIAMFTYHDPEGDKAGRTDYQYQAIAVSRDDGRTWSKFDKNPVIPNPEKLRDFRDPKVFWHEPAKRWIVSLAVGDHIRFYESADMKTWTLAGRFGGEGVGAQTGVWECPDLFPLKVEGTNETKWVLLVSINPGAPMGGSATQYFVGSFDGKTFRSDDPPDRIRWLDHGRDNYAGVTWGNVPNGRRIFLGWMSNWEYAQKVPTAPWRSAMTLPRDLGLRKTSEGIGIVQKFSPETAALRSAEFFNLKNKNADSKLPLGKAGEPMAEITVEIDLTKSSAGEFGIEAANAKGEKMVVGFEAAGKRFFTDRISAGDSSFSKDFIKGRHYAPRINTDSTVKLHVIFDAASVELIADDGTVAMTDTFFPSETLNDFSLVAAAGNARIVKARGWPLRSIWK